MAIDYGTTFACATDLTPQMSTVSGLRAVAEAVARRLQTDRGALWYDLDYGTNITRFVNAAVPLSSIETMVENEAIKDERVDDCTCEATQTGTSLSLRMQLEADEGPFEFVLSVSELTVTILWEAFAA